MTDQPPQLGMGGQVVLTAAGGEIRLGPAVDSRDPHTVWNIDTIIWKTSRPGAAPIPRLEVYLDDPTNFGNAQIVDYDGSFGTAGGLCKVVRGQTLRAVWTWPGTTSPGDIAYFAVTGTKTKN